MSQFRFPLPMKNNKMELVKLVKDVPKISLLTKNIIPKPATSILHPESKSYTPKSIAISKDVPIFVISFVAAKSMGYKFNDISETLNIYPVKCVAYLTGVHPVTAGRYAEKGKKLIDNHEGFGIF